MKTFDQYQDGDWVTYVKAGNQHDLMQFQAYKSKYTHNAFRLKYGNIEIVADISEVSPVYNTKPQSDTDRLMEESYENFGGNFQSGVEPGSSSDFNFGSDFQD